MIKKLWLDTLVLTLLIAMFIFLFYDKNTNPYIIKVAIEGNPNLYYYEFDFWPYLQNIQTSLSSTIEDLKPIENPLTWQEISGIDALADLANDFFYVINTFIYFINICLVPFRLIGWVGMNLLVLLGMIRNDTYINGQLYEPNIIMQIFKFWAIDLQIPMINN